MSEILLNVKKTIDVPYRTVEIIAVDDGREIEKRTLLGYTKVELEDNDESPEINQNKEIFFGKVLVPTAQGMGQFRFFIEKATSVSEALEMFNKCFQEAAKKQAEQQKAYERQEEMADIAIANAKDLKQIDEIAKNLERGKVL